jgi:predicted outer membrane repeat protein
MLPTGLYTLTIPGTDEYAAASGDLNIYESLIILGEGAQSTIVSGNSLDRVFAVAGTDVEISGMTIQNGFAQGISSIHGGGIHANNSTITLTNVIVFSNTATNSGGGVYLTNNASMALADSVIKGNSAASSNGGGIFSNGTMSITRVTIIDNSSMHWGGGIFSNGVMTVTNSSIYSNTVNSAGGVGGTVNQGTGVLINTTISGNSDGGFYNTAADDANGSLTNCTIANNTGVGFKNSQLATLKNTIVANNTISDCNGLISSGGYNLYSDNTCGLTGSGDISDTDPQLNPLRDNGGSTWTQALPFGSPAIDAIPFGACATLTDQRGIDRPKNFGCDIGAYEYDDVIYRISIPMLGK